MKPGKALYAMFLCACLGFDSAKNLGKYGWLRVFCL